MSETEVPGDPNLRALRRWMLDHGCTVDTHNAHGEWLEITMPVETGGSQPMPITVAVAAVTP